MTATKSRALLAALLLAAAPVAMTAAQAQDAAGRDINSTNDSEAGNRFQRKVEPKAQPANTVSSSVRGPLARAQDNLSAKKYPEALTSGNEALAAAKTDYEKFAVNYTLSQIHIGMGDQAGATGPAEAAADTPIDAIPAESRQPTYYIAAALSLNAKHNDKALTYAKALQSINATDARSQEIIGRALYANGDKGAVAFFQKQIDAAAAAGKVPDRNSMQMLLGSQIKAQDEAGAERTMVQQVLYYNDKEDWKQIIDVSISSNGVRDIDAVMLGRLLLVSGAPVSKENAQLIGETTQKLALYGDAQAAQAKGATLQLDPARVAADKASLPQQVGMAAGQNGLFSVKLAEAQYGYGMYAEAEASARLALSKGGADASEAQLLVGMSQVMQGKYADGVASLAQVKGGSPVTPRVAELWTAYAKNKGGLVPGVQASAR